jgi:AraC-like DNA-binding protein
MESVHVWRAGSTLCMKGKSTGYAVDPLGEHVIGIVLAGVMRAHRDGEDYVFGPGDICAWDPSAAHRGTPHECASWNARLIVLDGLEPLRLREPLVRDARLARRFVALHRALEEPSWALERDVLLGDWLRDLGGDDDRPEARRDPGLRRARDRLAGDLTTNVTLDELAQTAGVSRHRLSRLFRAAYGVPPHRFQLARRIGAARRMLERGVAVAEVAQATGFFDQSHLHRHFRRTLGMTPARYARLTAAQTYKTPPQR